MFKFGLVLDPADGEVHAVCGQCADAISTSKLVTFRVLDVCIPGMVPSGKYAVMAPLPGVSMEDIGRASGHGTKH